MVFAFIYFKFYFYAQNSESADLRLHPVSRRYFLILANCKSASSMVSAFKMSVLLRSERESRVKKFESPPSRSKKVEPISHLRANRSITYIIS